MTLLPPEYRGGEDPYNHRTWRERNGKKAIITTAIIGGLALISAYLLIRSHDESSPAPNPTTTSQPWPETTATTLISTTSKPATTSTSAAPETTTTYNADITQCIANFYKPEYKTEHDIVLGSARRAYIEQYGNPPEDPDRFAYNTFVASCKDWYKFGGRISTS